MNLNWVPQLFMDLIGRVLPGALIILCSVIVVQGPSHYISEVIAGHLMSLNWTSVFIWGMVSYLIGFTLGQFWHLTMRKLAEPHIDQQRVECMEDMLKEHNAIQVALGKPSLSLTIAEMPKLFVMHDHLRLASPGEASRLLKLRAERRMCHVIILGFGFLSLVNLALWFQDYDHVRWIVEIILIAVIMLCWSRQFRLDEHFTNGILNIWLMLASAGKLML